MTTPNSVETAKRVHEHRTTRTQVVNSRILAELVEDIEEFPETEDE